MKTVLAQNKIKNILSKYADYVMVNFVKPQLLGTQEEFRDRFLKPITDGQHKDSNAEQVNIMKHRAHVLHKLLDGCVHV